MFDSSSMRYDFFFSISLSLVTILDMNISQFLKSLGLEHLRDIFEREQVRSLPRIKPISIISISSVPLHTLICQLSHVEKPAIVS